MQLIAIIFRVQPIDIILIDKPFSEVTIGYSLHLHNRSTPNCNSFAFVQHRLHRFHALRTSPRGLQRPTPILKNDPRANEWRNDPYKTDKSRENWHNIHKFRTTYFSVDPNVERWNENAGILISGNSSAPILCEKVVSVDYWQCYRLNVVY